MSIIGARCQETSGPGPAVDYCERAFSPCDDLCNKLWSSPEGVDTRGMATQFVHDVEVVNPFLGAIYPTQAGIRRRIPALPAPEAVVERAFHDGRIVATIPRDLTVDNRARGNHGEPRSRTRGGG